MVRQEVNGLGAEEGATDHLCQPVSSDDPAGEFTANEGALAASTECIECPALKGIATNSSTAPQHPPSSLNTYPTVESDYEEPTLVE